VVYAENMRIQDHVDGESVFSLWLLLTVSAPGSFDSRSIIVLSHGQYWLDSQREHYSRTIMMQAIAVAEFLQWHLSGNSKNKAKNWILNEVVLQTKISTILEEIVEEKDLASQQL